MKNSPSKKTHQITLPARADFDLWWPSVSWRSYEVTATLSGCFSLSEDGSFLTYTPRLDSSLSAPGSSEVPLRFWSVERGCDCCQGGTSRSVELLDTLGWARWISPAWTVETVVDFTAEAEEVKWDPPPTYRYINKIRRIKKSHKDNSGKRDKEKRKSQKWRFL